MVTATQIRESAYAAPVRRVALVAPVIEFTPAPEKETVSALESFYITALKLNRKPGNGSSVNGSASRSAGKRRSPAPSLANFYAEAMRIR